MQHLSALYVLGHFVVATLFFGSTFASPVLPPNGYRPGSLIYRRSPSPAPLSLPSQNHARGQPFLRKRELIIQMLDGGPVESHFVNLLDLWSIAEEGVKNNPEGTPLHAQLVDFQETVATELTILMEGVAVLQSVITPTPTITLEIETIPSAEATATTENATIVVEATATSSSSEPQSTSEVEPEATPVSSPAPVSESQEVTPQETTSDVERTTTVAQPEPTPLPAPEPQPPIDPPSQPSNQGNGGESNQGGSSGNAGGAVGSGGNSGEDPTATVSRSGQAEAAQATDSDVAGSGINAMRVPSRPWIATGAVLAWMSLSVVV